MWRVFAVIIGSALIGCAVAKRGLPFPSQPELAQILAGSVKGAESFCPDFAKAKRVDTGSELDIAIRKAIEAYTHDSGFVAEVRLISPTRAVVAVVENPGFNL